MNKILYTGSLGFIFSNLIRRASFEKFQSTFCGVDRATDLKQINNVYNNKIISNNYLADVCDQHILNNIFEIERPNIVIHAASTDENQSDLTTVVNTNIVGTNNLIKLCKKHGVNKIIYLSTDKVYPTSKINESVKFSESNYLNPSCQTSISQLAAENLIINSGIDYNILRISDIYGPRQSVGNLIPDIVKSIINQQPIKISGDGMQTLDWSHVFDVSAAILTIVKSDLHNEIINVSSNQECSIIEITQFVCNAFKKGHNLIHCDHQIATNTRRCMDNSKLLSVGWKPMFKLKQGIEEVVNWYQINQWSLK